MKFAIVSRDAAGWIKRLLKKHKFKLVTKNPDIVISNGGDGTILFSERIYPGIPKLAIKTSKICRKCDYTSKHLDLLLGKIKEDKYKIVEMAKIEASFKGKKLIALNEIQVRHKIPTRTIRFSLFYDGRKYKNVVGDGVILATSFGSTAYYKSVGGIPFKKGIGIGFNNSYSHTIKSLVIPQKSKIRIRIERETALLIRDNDEKFYTLAPMQEVKVHLSKEKAKFLQF